MENIELSHIFVGDICRLRKVVLKQQNFAKFFGIYEIFNFLSHSKSGDKNLHMYEVTTDVFVGSVPVSSSYAAALQHKPAGPGLPGPRPLSRLYQGRFRHGVPTPPPLYTKQRQVKII
jgi:hypothetical protein